MANIATGNVDDALEIVQDAMFKLVRKYADKPASEWGPLFHCILQSSINDWFRKQSVRNRWRIFWNFDPENPQDMMDSVENTYTMQPEDQLKTDEAMKTLDGAIHVLPLRQQQAFLLRTIEGFNVKQTAKAMNCSEGSVKTHYSRAINSLRTQLENNWP